MGGVLRAERVWVETFTGLPMDRFVKLVMVVRERSGNGPGRGRPWCLPLADRVLLVAVYYRTNLTMRQLARRPPAHPSTWESNCPAAGAYGPIVSPDRSSLATAPRPVPETRNCAC